MWGVGGWCGRERRLAGELGAGGTLRQLSPPTPPARCGGGGGRRTGEDSSSPTHVTQERGRSGRGRRGHAASPRLGCPPPRGSVTLARRGGAWAGRSCAVRQQASRPQSQAQPPPLSPPAEGVPGVGGEGRTFLWVCLWFEDQAAYGVSRGGGEAKGPSLGSGREAS